MNSAEMSKKAKSQTKFRWGILGPGTIAHKFAEGLSALPDAILYAVASRSPERGQAFAEKYGFEKSYGSYKDLAEDPLVDIVYIATPHTQHEEAALMCLEHGKAVLCEKPLSVNAAQVERIVNKARDKGVFLMDGMWTRFLPAICKIRELLKSGAIGEVHTMYSDFAFRGDFNPNGRLFSPDYAGGSLLDVGIYNLYFCSMIFGPRPKRVQSHMTIGSTGVDEDTSVLLSYENGQSALLHSSIRHNTRHEAKIIGDKGRIEIQRYWSSANFTLVNDEGTQEFNLPFKKNGYEYEAIEVMRCLREGLIESPTVPHDETINLIRIMDQIRKDNGLKYPCDEE